MELTQYYKHLSDENISVQIPNNNIDQTLYFEQASRN